MANIILLNKPFNVLCQFTDKEGRANLTDYVKTKGVYPAGRLDYDSEGLIILTDDGQLQHQISHPSSKMTKTYWVQVEGAVTEQALAPLLLGITLSDGACRPVSVRIIEEPELWPRIPPIRDRALIPTTWLELSLSEGRNRQIRRMTAAVGFPTLRLVRIKIGDWQVSQLAPGESLQLTVHAATNQAKRNRHTTPRRRRL